MEFKGHIIMSLLRILTPEEISRLTTSHSGQKKVPLSMILTADVDGKNYRDIIEESRRSIEDSVDGGAKILKFDEGATDSVNPSLKDIPKKEKFFFQSGQRVLRLLEAYAKTFEKMNKNIFGQKRFPKKAGSANVKQASTMIIEEKRKLYNSYSKIKRMEVLSLYKNTSDVDIQSQKRNKEDLGHSSSLGVLINKKQA